jgi:hypothetical protein
MASSIALPYSLESSYKSFHLYDVEFDHKPVATFPTIPNLSQTTTLNLTTVASHHYRWKTNTLNTQHKSNSTS